MKSILWADNPWNHMGSHSGLAPFAGGVATRWGDGFHRVKMPPPKNGITSKMVRKVQKFFRSPVVNPQWITIREKWSPFYSEKAWNLENVISQQVSQTAPDCVVLECIEDQLFLLSEKRKHWPRTRLVGITHQPPAWWRLRHGRPEIVSSLDLLVVVASGVKSFWAQFIDPKKIVFLPHGVDSEFFIPLKREGKRPVANNALRVVFSGQHLRDFQTLAEVVNMSDQQALNVTFDLVIPYHARQTDACYRIAMSPRVRWHANLSDEELRAVYQHADILLLTLIDSTANNGLLEGMACGIPAIVTDVGGVRDYADNNIADLVAPGNATEVVQSLRRYLDGRELIAVRGAAAREHVEKHLSWKKVAEQFVCKLSEFD